MKATTEGTATNYKLTLDVVLDSPASVATLERWGKEGKIELIRANVSMAAKQPAYNWPGAPPLAAPRGRYKPKPKPKSNTIFREIAAVLFPHKDPQKLGMTEINGVAHLVRHMESHNEFFVTANLKDFILDGKRERLKNSFGIIALTPEEAVKALTQIENWK